MLCYATYCYQKPIQPPTCLAHCDTPGPPEWEVKSTTGFTANPCGAGLTKVTYARLSREQDRSPS